MTPLGRMMGAVLCAFGFALGIWLASEEAGAQTYSQPAELSWRINDGVIFRAATDRELRENGWPRDALLIVGSPERVRRERTLPVVFDTSTVERIPLEEIAVETGTEFHELSFYGDGGVETTVPIFYLFDVALRSRAKGRALVDDSGGMHAQVTMIVRGEKAHREIAAGEANMRLEQTPLPDGDVPRPEELLVIFTPGTGSPFAPSGSFKVEDPVNPRPIALFGTIYWCQQHPTNWKALIAEAAFEIRAGFRKQLDVQGNATTDTGWDIALATSWCMFFDASSDSSAAVDEAMWCEWGLRSTGNSCEPHTCADQQGFEYPLTGCYRQSGCIADSVWQAVEYADRYLALPDLELAMAQTSGGLQDAVDAAEVPSCPEDDIPNVPIVCGLAKSPTAGDLAGASVTPGRPFSLWPPTEPSLNACLHPFTWTHEVGHNFGAFHVTDFMNAPNNSGCDQYKTLMNTSGSEPAGTCTVNGFSVDMKEHMISTCIPGACPRAAPYVDQHP